MSTKSTHVWEKKAGRFTLTLWKHEPKDSEKANSTGQSFKLQRSYKKKSGDWVNEGFFLFADELEVLDSLIREGLKHEDTNDSAISSKTGS